MLSSEGHNSKGVNPFGEMRNADWEGRDVIQGANQVWGIRRPIALGDSGLQE